MTARFRFTTAVPAPILGGVALAFTMTAAPAFAQMGRPGMMPGMPPPQPGMGDDTKEEGPAEAAPDEDEAPGPDEPLGAYREERRRVEVVQLDGYFRVRTNWFHNLNLGQGPAENGVIPPPFPRSIDCLSTPDNCSKNLGTSDTRLRLEPIINVTEQVRVLSMIDILDNTILGSTPDSLVALERLGNARLPHPALFVSQDPPELDRNSLRTSVRAKRAWAEVDSEFGQLLFGRMPWHWGRGMYFNRGTCLDCDGAASVDRIMALSTIYGHQVALAWDFGGSGTVLDWTTLGRIDREAPPLDLSQSDDVFQLTGSILRAEPDEAFRARAARGELALNYGFQLVYRSQDRAYYPMNMDTPVAPGTLDIDDIMLGQGVNALIFIPDLWFKLGWKSLTIEFESAAVLGKIDNAGPLTAEPDGKLNVTQVGWVLASELALFKNAFFVGFETGGATGDQAENRASYLNYRWKQVVQPTGDNRLSAFHFSPEYHVDQILFRRILGTVNNAVYLKPQAAYWLGLTEARQLGVQASLIYSLANVAVSTPGNARSYGLELNIGATYRNPTDGFFAGATWGILWPLAALDRPAEIWNAGADDADSAQVIRTFLGIVF